jgi:hypothetical protein
MYAWRTDKMKISLSQIFQTAIFPNVLFCRRRYLCSGLCYHTKGQKAIVSILGTGSNCSYFDGKNCIKSTITSYIDGWSGNVLKRIN